MSSDLANDLLQRGLTAMDTGDTETALDYLRQTVEADPETLEAWEALATLVEDPKEKLAAYKAITQLDPDNKEAAKAINKLEKQRNRAERASSVGADDNEEWIPGIKRKELRLAGISLGVFTLVVFVLVFALISLVNGQKAAEEQALADSLTEVAQAEQELVDRGLTQEAQQTQDTIGATETQLALFTPTPTATSTPNLPPTFTPTAAATEIVARQFDLPPDTVVGTIYAWGGVNAVTSEFLDLRQYVINNDGEYAEINSDLAQSITVAATGVSAVYSRYRPSQDISTLTRIDLLDTTVPSEDLTNLYASASIIEAWQPSLNADGTKMVFISQSLQSTYDTLLMIDLTTQAMTVISRDLANYSHPTISNDGSYIAAIRTDDAGDVDLVLFDLTQGLSDTGFQMVDLTINNGAIAEAYPAFSPDSSLIAYSGAASNTPNNHEIFVIGLESGRPTPGEIPIAQTEADEIRPIFSPDGAFLAYNANPVLSYDIFIRNLTGNQVYQLTADDDNVFVGDWVVSTSSIDGSN